MAKKKITKKTRTSVVKKKWFSVKAPKVLNNVIVGETPAVEAKSLPGRSIKANLALFMKGGRRQNIDVKLRVIEVKGTEAITEFEGMTMVAPYVKRLVKRAKKRVDDSFVVQTKDEVKVRLKPLILVRGKVQRGVLTDLRNKTAEALEKAASESTFNELINKVLVGDLMKGLKTELKNVYSVHSVEMRSMVRVK